MQTNLNTDNDERLKEAATKLLSAAMDYWKEYKRVTGGRAVVWVADADGRCVVLTRGEYKDVLMREICRIAPNSMNEDILFN